MKFSAIQRDLDGIDLGARPLHLAVGMFDGVHLGHRSVIESAVTSARRSGGIAGVLTFWPHPSRVIAPGRATKLILPQWQKERLLLELGVDLVIQREFTPKFASIEAAHFIGLLKDSLPTLAIIYVGENFRFGRGRKGDVALMIREAQRNGMSVLSAERLRHNGRDISSTRIREALRAGDIGEANDQLGYTYFSTGTIRSGQQIGRRIGFPTINLSWTPELRPCFGVYVVTVRRNMDEGGSAGVANYGVKPTVSGDDEPTLEVHLLEDTDFASGEEANVDWHAFIRRERKFPDLESLVAQIQRDKEAACRILPCFSKTLEK